MSPLREGRKPHQDPWCPLGNGQRQWAVGGEGQAGWGSSLSCAKLPWHRAGVGSGWEGPLGRAGEQPQQGQRMSLMVAHKGGALCLGQGPSLSPQGPHTATPSLPLWHPSSTGESLGMGEQGLGVPWDMGLWGARGQGEAGRPSMGGHRKWWGWVRGLCAKRKVSTGFGVLGLLSHPWELDVGQGMDSSGIGCPGMPCHETSVPRPWQSHPRL